MSDEPVVVVGSGPSGASAAAQLAERGVDVVVLDAGRRAPRGLVVRAAGNTVFRWMDRSLYSIDRHVDAADTEVSWFSSLSHGGLSNYWTSAVPRFAPDDLSEGARLDERFRWPVTYDDLVPWYERAERSLMVTAGSPILGVPSNVARFAHRLPADWQQIADTAGATGYGVGAIPMAKGSPWMIALRGTEFSSFHCVLRPLVASARVRLIGGAHVSDLVWSARDGRVDAVRYVDATGEPTTIRCRAVVLAAGTIDSTVIALRSVSDDFPNGIGNARGLVGRYLHDHPRQWWTASTGVSLTAPAHPVYIARAGYDVSAPLMATSLTIGLAGPAERLRTYYRGRTDRFGVQVFGTMVPTSEIGISLPDRHEPDPREVKPVIRLQYDASARTNMQNAPDRLREVLATAGIGVTVPRSLHELHPGTSVHFGGSMRMHADPEHGVVDGWNRIHDAPNVVVADMSCFTTGPEKNPTLTAMALAMRAADRLASDLG